MPETRNKSGRQARELSRRKWKADAIVCEKAMWVYVSVYPRNEVELIGEEIIIFARGLSMPSGRNAAK